MTKENQQARPVHSAPMGKRMLQGASIAFIFISLFLFSAGEGDPNWPKYWMVKPLLVVPVAGALGGVFYYFMDHLRYQGGWLKVAAIFISLVGYLVALWLGSVLGLNGTYWN
jgi:hypothetical protein